MNGEENDTSAEFGVDSGDDESEQLKFLFGGYTRLSDSYETLEKKVDSMATMLLRLESRLFPEISKGKAVAESSRKQNQVPISNWESNRRDSQLSYRSEMMNLADRTSLLKKIDMPVFDGENAYEWLVQVERFFTIGRYSDAERLELVSLTLAGKVLKWFNWEMKHGVFTEWEDFKERLLLRFGEELEAEPGKKLFAIQQRGSMADYVSEFEDLSAQVSGLSDSNLTDIFYNGLRQEMKEVIKMKEPKGLRKHIAAVLRMETSFFCKAMGDMCKGDKKDSTPSGYTPLKTSSHYNTQRQICQGGYNLRNSNTISQPQEKKTHETNTSHNNLRPRQMYTDAELDAMRREGICFKCKGKYYRGHPCTKKELMVLTVVNGCEMEVMEEDWMISKEEVKPDHELMVLSLYSMMGISSPKTTRMSAQVGKVKLVVMVDSGASHNFIDPAAATKLNLKVSTGDSWDIVLGNGLLVKGLGIYKQVHFSMGGVEFITDFISLELDSVDAILGVQWLETLGKCQIDWKLQELTFCHDGQSVTLFGDLSLHPQHKSQQLREECCSVDLMQLEEHQHSDRPPLKSQPEIEEVLDAFVEIVAMPSGLPPWRGHEHNITLTHGVNAISLKPYRYPHASKVAYGRDPPLLLKFEEGSTTNYDLETSLRERDEMLQHIKENRLRAQQIMNRGADKHRRHVEFKVGDMVFLKLQPYRQNSVVRRLCQKLAATSKFYDTYEVLEVVGKVAYRLKLPSSTKIHHVFHVAQLKVVVGEGHAIHQLPQECSELVHDVTLPAKVLATRHTSQGVLELLVQWMRHPEHDNTWVIAHAFIKQFPDFKLEDKLNFKGGSIDRCHQAYFRRKKRGQVISRT